MNPVKVAAIVLIVAGGLVLISGNLRYTSGHPRSQTSCTPVTPAPPGGRAPTPQPASKAVPPVAKATVAGPPLDFKSLEQQLKDTRAIGFFTKITLKNQVEDLMDQFRKYYQGSAKLTMADLRRSYDMLMMKALSLLQDEDQKLASAIVSSREAIWALLADPVTFATLEG